MEEKDEEKEEEKGEKVDIEMKDENEGKEGIQ